MVVKHHSVSVSAHFSVNVGVAVRSTVNLLTKTMKEVFTMKQALKKSAIAVGLAVGLFGSFDGRFTSDVGTVGASRSRFQKRLESN